jgi:hypothetical protein
VALVYRVGLRRAVLHASVTSPTARRTDARKTCADSSASLGGEPVLDSVRFGADALYYVERLMAKRFEPP